MTLLDDLKAVRRIDRSDMLGKAAALPAQCREGWLQGADWKLPTDWSRLQHLVILGMGGSAIGGDLLHGMALKHLSRPLTVNRSYAVPRWVGRQSLVLACSYSGNTEETLSAAQEAARKGARLAVLTSGGRLAAWASREGCPLLRIPTGWPPRSAVGYMTFSPLGLLVRLGWLKRADLPVEESCGRTEEWIREALAPGIPTQRNPAKRLAGRLAGRLPVFYGASDGWEGLTYRWRTQMEENAKTLSFHHLFPEATHNEISGWLQPRKVLLRCAAVFLTDPAVHPRTARRMEFAGRIARRQGAETISIRASDSLRLARLLKLIALGDFVSIYLGLLYRVDPTPVERVEALKRYLKG